MKDEHIESIVSVHLDCFTFDSLWTHYGFSKRPSAGSPTSRTQNPDIYLPIKSILKLELTEAFAT